MTAFSGGAETIVLAVWTPERENRCAGSKT